MRENSQSTHYNSFLNNEEKRSFIEQFLNTFLFRLN